MRRRYPIRDKTLYWLEKICAERFGHKWKLKQKQNELSLSLEGGEGEIIFCNLQKVFTETNSNLPMTQWKAHCEGWISALGKSIPAPGVGKLPSPLIEKKGINYVIHYDIFGLTYWMLNRIEEIGREDLDIYGRFPAISSHAFHHDYLERPLVDEWLYILGQVIKRQWPAIKIIEQSFYMRVSHDVDRPSLYGFKSWPNILRIMGGDVFRRFDFKRAALAAWVRMNTRKHLHPCDPANTFDWIMDVSEACGMTSAFYFICGRTVPDFDADYELEHRAIRALMVHIHQRGHEIGLHPSYGTYQTPSILKEEADSLRRIASEEGIQQEKWGGRMHYLRWEHPKTLKAWSDSGLSYDSSLGYADRPGFRCGTCFEYPAFDPVLGELLALRIRPLIAMETTIFAPHYLALGTGESAKQKFEQLKSACQAVGGCFTLLWHNCQFQKKEERRLYKQILESNQTKNLAPYWELQSGLNRMSDSINNV